MADKLVFAGIMQVAYIVPDLQRAMEEYGALLKVGPWHVSRHFSGTEKLYRGQPTDIDMTIAMSYSGQMNIELIQQLDGGPSVYREVADKRGYGFHHWGVVSRDFDRDVEMYKAKGYEIAFSTRIRDARLAYLDTTRDMDGMVELIEVTPGVEERFTLLWQSTVGWDGKDPIRVRA